MAPSLSVASVLLVLFFAGHASQEFFAGHVSASGLVLFFAGHAGATLEVETCITSGDGYGCDREATHRSLLQVQRGSMKQTTEEEKSVEVNANVEAAEAAPAATRDSKGENDDNDEEEEIIQPFILTEKRKKMGNDVNDEDESSRLHDGGYMKRPLEDLVDEGGYMKRPFRWDALFQGSHIDDNVTDLPKDLYMFWDQGDVQNTTPPLNKMCFEKWPALNPTWNYHLVTGNHGSSAEVSLTSNAEVSLTNLVPHLTDLFQANPRTVQQRSDMLRLEIMAEYGGVWVDGSLLPILGLDTFAKHLVAQSGFFVFTYPNTEDPFFHYNASNDPSDTWISSWFMVSKPQNPLVVAWRDAFKKKWMDPGHNFTYFEVHETFKAMILEKDPHVIEVWRSMPRISSHWPQLCFAGCADYWQTSNRHDRPPFLKRPYQKDGKPPSEWLEQWRDLLPQTAQTAQ